MANVEIDQSAGGSTVHLHVGEQAQVSLAETRSGGYKWLPVSPESTVFSVKDEGFETAFGVGGTGVHRWTITAKQAGESKFALAHGRSWEPETGKRFEVTIVVK